MNIFKKNKEDIEVNMNKNNASVKIERVPTTSLHTHLYFQNDPNPVRVKQIVDNFDWNLLQPLDVSFRDGKYNVVDGQNRLYATIEKFKDSNKIITLPCLVRYGMSESDEMKLFIDLAKLRRHVKPIEIYQAFYGMGNEFVKGMVDTIRKVGLIFDFKSSQANGRITAAVAIHNIYGQLGKTDFEKYLRLLYLTWNGNSKSLQKNMLDGLFDFYQKYMLKIDEKTFIRNLSKKTPEEIYRDGGKEADGAKGISEAIFKQYNKRAGKFSLK